jgi:alkanesulfonate monooxygenase SsuD/methylene tetrahydromethanopterin reductase-like flavin-dependent oxidoreductase (luciferase family)
MRFGFIPSEGGRLFEQSLREVCYAEELGFDSVWLGGWGELALKRAAELADAWVPGPTASLQKLLDAKATYHQHLADMGKDPRRFPRPLTRELVIAETAEQARALAEKHLLVNYRDEYGGGWSHPLIDFGTLATAQQVQMYQAAMAHDFDTAFRLSEIVQPLADVIFAPPVPNYRARTKEALVMLGALPNAVVWPPLLPLSAAEREMTRRALVRAGQPEAAHM